MNMKHFFPLCILLLLLGACSDDAERTSLPDSFEARDIDYFFEEGDSARTYEVLLESCSYNNASEVWQDTVFDLTKHHAEYVTFSSPDPTAFSWCAAGDTVWVDDITVSDGLPDNSPIIRIPYMEGTTQSSAVTQDITRISVPPHTAIRINIFGLFGEVTASYALEMANITTGETREIKGKVKKKRLLAIRYANGDQTDSVVVENAPRRR